MHWMAGRWSRCGDERAGWTVLWGWRSAGCSPLCWASSNSFRQLMVVIVRWSAIYIDFEPISGWEFWFSFLGFKFFKFWDFEFMTFNFHHSPAFSPASSTGRLRDTSVALCLWLPLEYDRTDHEIPILLLTEIRSFIQGCWLVGRGVSEFHKNSLRNFLKKRRKTIDKNLLRPMNLGDCRIGQIDCTRDFLNFFVKFADKNSTEKS